MEIMNILLVNDSYGDGGASTIMQRLAHELTSRRHEVNFAVGEGPSLDNLYTIHHFNGISYHLFRRLPFFNIDPFAYRDFEKLVKKIKPDVVHCHNLVSRLSLEIVKVALKYTIPCVITIHDYWPVCVNRSLLKGSWRKPSFEICNETNWRNCARECKWESMKKTPNITWGMSSRRRLLSSDGVALVAVSNYVKKVLQRFHYGSSKIKVIYNGVDVNRFTPRSNCSDKMILFLGGNTKLKGIEHFLIMAKRIRRLTKRMRFVVTGERIAYAPDFIENPGRVPLSDLIGYYQRALCTCIPSLWPEPLPTVALESMACARPVVAYAVGGLVEIVKDGKTGFLVRRGDIRKLTEVILWLGDNEDAAKHMGLATRNHVKNRYTIQRMCNSYERLYEELASQRPL